jgi:cob(I)alamin adenosyltransferase
VQSRLFGLGAELAATAPESLRGIDRISNEDVLQLEQWIDELDRVLPPLRSFVLPGGTELASHVHLARTVCRRAERRVVALLAEEVVSPSIVVYLNRLADLLFTQARWCNAKAGQTETEWHGREPRSP